MSDETPSESLIQTTDLNKEELRWLYNINNIEPSELRPDYERIPFSTFKSLRLYQEGGVIPGSFLHAVLANDLMEAMGKADIWNRQALFHICAYIWEQLPAGSHGSYETVQAWSKSFYPSKEE